MENNKNIKNTWLMVTLLTSLAFIISGLVQLKIESLIWPSVMKFASALALILFSIAITIKHKRIFNNPAPYVFLYFLGYVLVLVGLMTTINKGIWATGILLLLIPLYLAFRRKPSEN